MYNFSIFLILFGFILIDGFGIEIKPKSKHIKIFVYEQYKMITMGTFK